MSVRTILKHVYENGGMTEYQYERIDRVLKERERPHGEWIPKPKRVQVDETDEERIFETKLEWFCSSCAKSFGNFKPDDSFCKYCGSDNREEGEDE